jgi:ankyrin repeat protein
MNADEFFAAIQKGDKTQVESLLGSDPDLLQVSDESGISPILTAVYHQQPEIADLLAERTVLLTIFEAAALGRIQHVIRLLAKDPELVNAYADDGFQPLGLAAFFSQVEVADYLLKAGAWVNSVSRNQMRVSPLNSAAAAGNTKIVDLLLKHGADPNIRQGGGFTPLHAAAQNGDTEMIKLLLFNGADLRSKTEEGKTALDLACEQGHEESINLLKEGITKRFRNLRKRCI